MKGKNMSVIGKLLVASLALGASLSAWAQVSAPASLCEASERVLFTCPVGKKLLSVCASQDLDASKGVMQYRFGTSEKNEMLHPEVAAHPKQHFKFNRVYSSVEQAEILELEFKRGNVGYSVFKEWIKGKEAAGVNVTVGSKITTLKCKSLAGIRDFSEINQLDLPEM
jgi:hypothetical protein